MADWPAHERDAATRRVAVVPRPLREAGAGGGAAGDHDIELLGNSLEMLQMFTIILQALGWLMFLGSTIAMGAWLRRNPGKRNAERASRILHFLFWLCVFPPAGFGLVYPGLAGFDRELGLSPLPRHSAVLALGVLGLLIGAYLVLVSNVALRLLGKGANAFWLTKELVVGSIYKRMRNPMALGIYTGALAIGLLVGSTYMTLGTLFVVIPVHVFYLKYFEEYELELRLGQPYVEYKEQVPFLLPRWIPHKR
ncbi:MAG: methyltransferase [Anaerolineae bacterium]